MKTAGWVLGVVTVLAGCADKTPASIELAPGSGVLLGSQEIPLRATVKNKGGEQLQEQAQIVVEPADVAVVTQARGLKCTKAGDVTVVASAGTAAARGAFRCRPVARVEVPDDVRLIIPNGPVRPAVALFDASGVRFDDVQPILAVSDPSVASASGGEVTPVSVGRTTLTATAGDARGSVPVTVVRKIKTDPLLLNDGSRVAYTLQQGRYEVEVKGKATNGAPYGVTLKWVGGDSDCKDEREAQEIASTCTVANTGSVIIENPSGFGLGPAFDGFVNIYQVP